MNEMVLRASEAARMAINRRGATPESIARAVIEAMREPTDAMLRDSEVKTIGPARLGIWWAMIDAALAEDREKAL